MSESCQWEITADYTTRQLRKHGVIKVCSIEYLTIEIELVFDPNFQVLDCSQNHRIFHYCLDIEISIAAQQLTLFWATL